MARLPQERLQVLGHVAAGYIDAPDCRGHCEAFVDGHGVRYAVPTVKYDACGPAGRVEREYGLDGRVQGRHVERLE